MAINNFKPFALDPNANVTSQADWEALPALLSGFTAGKASSAQVNKAIRQASFIAAALAQYTANKSGLDVLDDGDLNGFISKMGTAFGKDFQALDATLTALAGLATGANKLPYFTGTDTAAQTDLTSVGRDIIGKNTIADILTYLGLSNVIYGGFDGDDIARPYMWYSTTGQGVYLTTNVFLSSELDKKQPLDATLTALAGLTNGANKLPYFTGADQMATADLSAFIRTMLGKADAAAVLAYLGIPDALALKADLSSFHTTRSNTFIAANQPFTGASSGVLRFMCGEFTGTTDKDGNLTVTLPDTYLGKIIYAEAHQFNGGYAGNTDPLIFSSYVLPNTAAASVTFAVRNTKTGMAAGNVQLSCLYFTRGV